MARGLGLRPVNSLKHIVDTATSTVLATISTVPVIQAVDNPGFALSTQVNIGSTIKWIYLRVEVISTTSWTGVPRVYFTVFKNPGSNLGSPPPNAMGGDNRRKFVIHQEMTMVDGVPDVSEFPRTMFQGVIKIPPRLRRFGVGDVLNVLLQNGVGETTGIANVCVQCIYKEFN